MSTPQNQVFLGSTLTNVVTVVSPGPQGPTGPIGTTGPTGPTGPTTIGATTVSLLGTPILGTRSMVKDATATTFASIIVGGGTNTVPCYADGTNWRIG